MTDEESYRLYLEGDETGLEQLMERYGTPLTLYINGYLQDEHEAEELMIDAMAYLLVKKPRIRDGGLKAYLYKSARHLALRRKSRRTRCFSLDELPAEIVGTECTDRAVHTGERNRALHLCMQHLNPQYREALYLTYFAGMSYAQAAQVMGKNEKQISNMVYRGKQSLRELLRKEGITHAEE